MGVGTGLAAGAVFATAGGGWLGAGTAILFGGAADVCENEGEKAEAEDDGFHVFDVGRAGLSAASEIDVGARGFIPSFRRIFWELSEGWLG
jgi:hypothetical protein